MDELLDNHVKSRLASGGYALGTAVWFVRTPAMMRMIRAAGYDFVTIDMEHSSFSLETISDMCELAHAIGLVPVIRPDSHSRFLGNRLQDLGALGLMQFDIRTRSEVDEILDWMRYPPDGSRPAFTAAFSGTKGKSGQAVNSSANANMLLVIQVESQHAVEKIDDILLGGGIDVVEVGRSDLSTSYGVPGQRNHALVLEAVDRIVAACQRHGVAVGAGCTSQEDAEDMIRKGVRYLMYPASDFGVLKNTYQEGNRMLRHLTAARAAPPNDGRGDG